MAGAKGDETADGGAPEDDRKPLGYGLWRTVKLLPKVSVGHFAVVVTLVLVSATLPVMFTLASGTLVGRVPAAVTDGLDGPGGQAMLRMLAVVVGLFLAQQVVGIIVGHATDVLGRRFNGHLRDRVVAASLDPDGIAHLEDPAVLDTMSLARNVAPGYFTPGSAVYGLAIGAQSRLATIGSALVIGFYFSWPLAILMLILSAISQWMLLQGLFSSVRMFSGSGAASAAMRRAVYFRDLSLTPPATKEVRIFSLASWLSDRHRDAWMESIAATWAERKGRIGTFFGSVAVGTAGSLIGLVIVVHAAVDRSIDLGTFAILVSAILGVANFEANDNDLRAAYGAASVPAILDLEAAVEPDRVAAAAKKASVALAAEQPTDIVRFEDVGFSYPSGTKVFESLDLEIPAGRSLAVVGVNGAGKTTMVKLLCGLYQPTSGRITVDGTPLGDIDPDQWRRHVAVLFQDYVRYELPADDNVGFGAIHLADHDAMVEAARQAGADEIIEGLPEGWQTVLSRTRTGGVDLSGGQWQRVALARALLAVRGGARVLVLDEPTANLDVRAEADIYERFLDLTQGLTSIVISHRFSTVRRADNIVVVNDGQVIESGSHDELVALGGRYATMFRVQADRYRDDDSPPDDGAAAALTGGGTDA